MKLIKQIKLISQVENKDILLTDLKKVFEQVNKSSYEIDDFEFNEPTEKDKKILEKSKSEVSFCVWTKSKSKNIIYFPNGYFELEEASRISYFFHEICHFIVYSTIKESEKIIIERQKIDEEYRKLDFPSGELVTKHTHSYLLAFFNEQLTDRLIIKLKSELFIIKLRTTIKTYSGRVDSINNLYGLYQHIIDIIRSIELIKYKTEYTKELESLQKLSDVYIKKLKEECEEERFNIYMEYNKKLINSYESEDASLTIKTFNELISKLIKC